MKLKTGSIQNMFDNADILEKAIQLHCKDDLPQAKQLYEQILYKEPENAMALHLLGAIALSVGNMVVAETLIKKSLKVDPTIVDAYNNLGTLYEIAGKLEESIEHYLKALKINPELADIHFNLANVLRSLGKSNDSYDHFKKATTLKQNFAAAYRQMTSVKKYKTMDEDIEEMEKLISHPAANDEQKMHLAFGLGKAYDDLNQLNKSFSFIALGNQLKRKSLIFNIENWDKQVNNVINTFNEDLFKQNKSVGSNDLSPIFILGMPRSGTSLVEQIISSHSQVFGAGEVHALTNSISSHTSISNIFDELSLMEPYLFQKMGETYTTSMNERKLSVGDEYSKNKIFTTDKMPGNFKLIGMIKLILPNAKIIHCTRDPMDNCYSIFKNYFSKGHIYAYDQTELAQYYQGYQRLMDHWNKVLPGYIYNLKYENLVAEQESETRVLLNFCKLPWEKKCLDFYSSNRAVKTVSAIQVRRPMNKDSISSWKKHENHLKPLYMGLSKLNQVEKY